MSKGRDTEGLLPDKYIRELEGNLPEELRIQVRLMRNLSILAKNLPKSESAGLK